MRLDRKKEQMKCSDHFNIPRTGLKAARTIFPLQIACDILLRMNKNVGRGKRPKVWYVLGFKLSRVLSLDVNHGTCLSKLMLLVIVNNFGNRYERKNNNPNPTTNHSASALASPGVRRVGKLSRTEGEWPVSETAPSARDACLQKHQMLAL